MTGRHEESKVRKEGRRKYTNKQKNEKERQILKKRREGSKK